MYCREIFKVYYDDVEMGIYDDEEEMINYIQSAIDNGIALKKGWQIFDIENDITKEIIGKLND